MQYVQEIVILDTLNWKLLTIFRQISQPSKTRHSS
jgi:hypothetical protein